jgi:hypothetical protein
VPDNARFLNKFNDKTFLLSMLDDPARTLHTYNYSAKNPKTVPTLNRIRDAELKRIAAAVGQTVQLGPLAKDKVFLASMIDDPVRTSRQYGLAVKGPQLIELEKVTNQLLTHATVAFRTGVNPVAADACNGCNAC